MAVLRCRRWLSCIWVAACLKQALVWAVRPARDPQWRWRLLHWKLLEVAVECLRTCARWYILAGAALLRLTWPFPTVLAIWFSGLPPPPRYHSRCLFSSYAASRHLWNTIFILHGSFYLGVVPSRTQLLAACYWPSDVQVLPSGEAVRRLLGVQHWLCEHGAVPPGIRSCHLMLRMERRWRSWSLVRVMMCLR